MDKALQIYKMLLSGQPHWKKNYFCVKTKVPELVEGPTDTLTVLRQAQQPVLIEQLNN